MWTGVSDRLARSTTQEMSKVLGSQELVGGRPRGQGRQTREIGGGNYSRSR